MTAVVGFVRKVGVSATASAHGVCRLLAIVDARASLALIAHDIVFKRAEFAKCSALLAVGKAADTLWETYILFTEDCQRHYGDRTLSGLMNES